MPSPFPGMDPRLESERWKGFHTKLLHVVSEVLVERLRPRYVIELDDSDYFAPEDHPSVSHHWDLHSFDFDDESSDGVDDSASMTEASTVYHSAVATLQLPHMAKQNHLLIRRRNSEFVDTVIELLSPWTKSGDGRTQYLGRRAGTLASHANLVEIDLLRGGQRIPTLDTIPSGDYFAFISRQSCIPIAEVTPWHLRDPLPKIPVPLAPDDADCTLDLQGAFTTAFDRAGFDYTIRHTAAIVPPLSLEDGAWVRTILGTAESHATNE